MESTLFDLETTLMTITDQQGQSEYTIRQAVEGLQIFGSIGSGKSSGSGRTIAMKYLSHGFGGLVLTAKEDEAENFKEYCRLTGRLNDIIMVEPGGDHFFDFIDYEASQKVKGFSLTDNVLQVLKTVIRATEEKDGKSSDDPFWETALDMLVFHLLELCQIAYDKISIKMLHDIALSIPKANIKETDKPKKGSYAYAFREAQKKVNTQISRFKVNLTPEQVILSKDPESYEQLIIENIPDAATLRSIDHFFIETFRNISEKTRSIIEFIFVGFMFRLTKEPVYSLFCKYASTFTPEFCLEGKIIIINLPVKIYHKVGRDIQIMFKYIFQRAMEKRDIKVNGRPVFLWADESQNFLHEYDAEYQATARSSRIATVYLSQNLPNYFANMGGEKSQFKVKSFLGTLGTKIFHANADIDTNEYASKLIGDGYIEDKSTSKTVAGTFSSTQGSSYKLERIVRPEHFVSLKTGGPKNIGLVQCYMHRQSNPFHDGQNFRKLIFKQS